MNTTTRYRNEDHKKQEIFQRIFQEAEDRHTLFFLDISSKAELALKGEQQEVWIEQLKTDLPNIEVVIERTWAQGAIETMLLIVSSLWRFWEMQGYLTEGREWLA